MILTKIREKTMVYHDDFTGWANKILDGTANHDEYKNVLKRFYGFYQPLENKISSLEDWATNDFNLKNRDKSAFLLEDMKYLNISDQEIAALEVCEQSQLPDISNMAQALGCMYVLEGATLGGQIVSKKLNEIFGFEQGKGSSFFNSYGTNVRPMWKEFGDFINNYSEKNKDDDNEIVNSSDQTYHKFNNWLAVLR